MKFDKNVWDNACTGMITDECDELDIDYICLTRYKSNNRNPFFYGFARTVELKSGNYKDENINLGLGFLDSLSCNDILIVKGSNNFAYFGELMTRFSIKKGISGVIIDGATRDNNYTVDKPLDIMFKHKTPVDIKGRGKVKSVDKDIIIEGRVIQSMAFVFADSDGVVIINKEKLNNVENAVKHAIEKEKKIIKKIQEGISIFEIIDKFKSF